MTSKERVRAAFEHKDTDRVPINFMCVDDTAWEKMRAKLGVETDEEVRKYFESDIRYIYTPAYNGPALSPPRENEKGELIVEMNWAKGLYMKRVWNGMEYNWVYEGNPYNTIKSLEEVETSDVWMNPDHFDYDAIARWAKENEDKALEIGLAGPYQVFTFMYDLQTFYENMYEEPELVKAILDKYCDCWYQVYERMFEATNDKIDILCLHDDYGSQKSLLFSPSMWDEFFRDNTKRFVDLAHKHGAYYMQHSCGAVRKIIPNLIECGVDALEPIQKVEGMDVDELKAEYGDKLLFQGGVDTQHILPNGTPEEVYAESTRVIKALYKNGGYILCGSQDLQADVPVENVKAMYEAAKQFWK